MRVWNRFGLIPSLLPFLAPETGSGGDGGQGGDGGDGGNNDGDPPGKAGNGEPPDNTGGNDPPPGQIVFPDEASFMRRVRQASRQLIQDEFKDLGLSSLEDVKAAAQRAVEEDQKNQSEAEKQKARADAAEKARDEAIRHAQENHLRAQVTHLATTDDKKVREKFDKIVDPDTAFLLMDRSGIEFLEDGTPTGVDDALAKLVADKPFLRVSSEEPSQTVPATPKGSKEPKENTSFAQRYLAGKYKGPPQRQE